MRWIHALEGAAIGAGLWIVVVGTIELFWPGGVIYYAADKTQLIVTWGLAIGGGCGAIIGGLWRS